LYIVTKQICTSLIKQTLKVHPDGNPGKLCLNMEHGAVVSLVGVFQCI